MGARRSGVVEESLAFLFFILCFLLFGEPWLAEGRGSLEGQRNIQKRLTRRTRWAGDTLVENACVSCRFVWVSGVGLGLGYTPPYLELFYIEPWANGINTLASFDPVVGKVVASTSRQQQQQRCLGLGLARAGRHVRARRWLGRQGGPVMLACNVQMCLLFCWV